METLDELFEQAKRLNPEDIYGRVALLEKYLTSIEVISEGGRSDTRMASLSGIAHSDWSDVSSHKGKHAAEIYTKRW